jgi:type IV pilus assembly protein PilV
MPVKRRLMNIHRRDGFTLVEVLVALVVLSIGLLGIGKLVMFSSRANDSAYMRSQATALAYTMLDDMRANLQDAINGAYGVGLGAYANPGVTCDDATPCTTTGQLAQYDLWQWKSAMVAGLPSGDGTVTTTQSLDPVTGATITLATITVQWNDAVAQQSFGAVAAGQQTQIVTLETQL